MANENVHPIFKGILDSIYKEEKTQHPYEKAAIKFHTNDLLSGNYPLLHMTPESECVYTSGFFAGVAYGLQLAQQAFDKTMTPTLDRQDSIADIDNHPKN